MLCVQKTAKWGQDNRLAPLGQLELALAIGRVVSVTGDANDSTQIDVSQGAAIRCGLSLPSGDQRGSNGDTRANYPAIERSERFLRLHG
jgi:hypothetical protein